MGCPLFSYDTNYGGRRGEEQGYIVVAWSIFDN